MSNIFNVLQTYGNDSDEEDQPQQKQMTKKE